MLENQTLSPELEFLSTVPRNVANSLSVEYCSETVMTTLVGQQIHSQQLSFSSPQPSSQSASLKAPTIAADNDISTRIDIKTVRNLFGFFEFIKTIVCSFYY